jgi:DNA-binding YbaB/EbfC family protein
MMKGLGNLMRQAKQLQEELARKQAEIAALRIDASSGGGMVTATVNGRGELVNLTIEKEVVDPNDVEMLVDLVVAAVQEAQNTAKQQAQEMLGPLTQGIQLPELSER